MREDMAKVIVERPRRGGGVPYPRPRFRDDRAFEDAPRRESMEQPWRSIGWHMQKTLNENLAPLRRFLDRNVGRPWNNVHSELCAHMDVSSAVQLHIWQHVEWFVDRHPLSPGSMIGYPDFYVDPQCGLLRRCRRHGSKRSWRAQREAWLRDRGIIKLGDDKVLRRINGMWYELQLAPLPQQYEAGVFDHALREEVRWRDRERMAQFHGRAMYACSKRQLRAKELRELTRSPRPSQLPSIVRGR